MPAIKNTGKLAKGLYMASQDISIRLKMAATGVDQQVENSERIADNYAKANSNAQKLASAPKARAAAMTGSRSSSEMLEYTTAGGITGRGGAQARDFANQAQGLGGLVRLYATFAANIFAVSAAFNVLRNAMDTTNMIAGLNALGAESGRSLGNVSKQLAAATDGAISLREAMTATAMASSAGMTNQQILRLGNVAKTASLALGISMPDAINRLTRGIVKLEPELLDELGIFTKIEPATQAYALQLGKTVSQLTDFERRQGFANAVLKEGEDKFRALGEAAVNPYDKLLAGLKDVAFQGLELINKVLTPIVKILAESPGALGAGLAALIALLLKQAIPAITQVRASMAASADAALQAAKGKQGDVLNARKQLNRLIEREVEASADKELKILEQKEAKVNELKAQGHKFSKQLTEALKKDIVDLTDQDIKAAKAQAQRLQTRAARSTDEGFKARAKAEMETVTALEAHYKAEQNLTDVKVRNRDEITKTVQATKQYQSLQKEVTSLEEAATKKSIVSNMAYNTSLVGIGNAWKLMGAEIEESGLKLNKFDKGLLLLRGGFAGLVGIVSTLGAAINQAFFVITSVIAIIEVLDSFFSKNEKQSKAFEASIDGAKSSVENATRTIDNFESKTALGKNSIKSIGAMTNAFGELAQSLETVTKKFEESMNSMGGWDRAWDRIKSIVGLGTADKFAKSVTDQIQGLTNLAAKLGVGTETQAKFKELLKVENIYDSDAVEEAVKKLSNSGREALVNLASNVNTSLQKVNSQLQGFKDSTEKATKSFQEFIQSTSTKDPFFTLAENLLNASFAMQDLASASFDNVVLGFQDLIENTDKLILLSPQLQKEAINLIQPFKDQKSALDGINAALDKYERTAAKAEKQVKAIEPIFSVNAGGGRGATPEAAPRIGTQDSGFAEAELRRYKTALDTKALERARDIFKLAAEELIGRAQRYAGIALENAAIRAGVTISKAAAQLLGGGPGQARIETRAALAENQVKIREAKIGLEMLDSQDSLTNALQAQTAATLANTEMLKPEGQRSKTILENADNAAKAVQLIEKYTAQLGGKAATNQSAQQFLQAQNLGEGDSEAVKQFNRIIAQRVLRRSQVQATVTQLEAEGRATKIGGKAKEEQASLADARELNQLKLAELQIQSSILSARQQIVGFATEETVAAKAKLESETRSIQNESELADINLKIKQAKDALKNLSGEDLKDGQARVKYLESELKPAIQKRQLAQKTAADQQTELENLQLIIQGIDRRYETEKSNRDLINAKNEAGLEIQRAQLSSAAELYDLDKRFVIQKTFELDQRRTALDFTKREGEIVAEQQKKDEQFRERIAKANEPDKKRLEDERRRQQELTYNTLEALQVERETRLDILRIQKEQALEQEKVAYEIYKANTLASALSGAFGTTGDKLGAISTALIDFNQKQEQGQKALATIAKARAENELAQAQSSMATGEANIALMDKANELRDAEGRQIQKNRETELNANTKVLASAKTLFKQHTGAYKTLNALEKAYHIARMVNMGLEMAMSVKKMAMEISTKIGSETAQTLASINGVLSRMPFMIGEIYGKTIGQLGIFGPPVAAALVALAFGSIGGKGKGGAPSTVGLTAEDMNKVTGTGQEYKNGQLVTREGGVLGDPTALADSVTSSIDKLSKNVFNIFNSDSSKIIKNLRGVERNTKETVKALIEPAGTLVGGQSPFGTIEGTTKTQDPWWRWGPLKSKTVSTQILSSGIQVQGQLEDLINQTGNTIIRSFENVQTRIKKKFFGVTYSDKTSISTEYGSVSQEVIDAFRDALKGFKETMFSAAETLEGSSTRIKPIIENFAFELTANLQGLTAQERSAKILGELSRNLNNATLAAYPWITAFTDLNEEYFEALSRVAIEGEQLTYGLGLLGLKINETDLYARTLAEQDLIAGAGGLEQFADGLLFIVDNFLSESERLALTREKVSRSLNTLAQQYNNGNIAVIKTREEYLRLITSLDLSSKSGRDLFNSLRELAPTFEEVAKASDEVINIFKDIQAQIFDLEFAMTPLEKALNGINRQQQEYIDKLKAADQAIYENIETVVKWAKLSSIQEIDKEIQKLYETRRNEINGTIESLKAAKTRILDLKNALLQGVQSILTPQEKYIKLLDEYNATLEKAKTGDKAALERFPQLSQSLLDSGREMYSSSQVYTDLFNTVSSDLTNLDLSLSQQLSDAEQQLQQLESQTSFLQKIDSSTNATATKLAELIALRDSYSSINIRDIALQLTPLSSPTTTPIPSAVSTATYTGNPSNTNNAPSITGGFSNLTSNILSLFGIQYGTKSTQIDTTEIVTAITTGNQQVVEAVESLEVTTAKANVANANTITNAITTNSSNTVYESRVDGFVQYYVTG